ncbi:ATP-binding cassette domain-containing protein [Berryella intestinalis]|uniref:ATP-binding cassette domain-containing protein n=1 Tax=Berryella intestinalis TaxID=1531429 RepID=UPI0009E2D386|nr:ATP-binding cassette domain-containing protein [Berryella intestinalis]
MGSEGCKTGLGDPSRVGGRSASGSSDPCAHGGDLLRVEGLSIGFRMYDEDSPSFFHARRRERRVIDNLCLSVDRGEIVAVVGASGSGKTLLANAVLGSFEPNAVVSGDIWFEGRRMDARALAAVRGNGISLVPQSVAFLDPLMKVGRQVEGLVASGDADMRRARRKELFSRYRLDERVADLYPFELSGGMARRVLLCCALIDEPRLIIADEPTPGLDLPLALKALGDFRSFADTGGGVVLITHDIELALKAADRVAVFKDGTVVEEAPVGCFDDPECLAHPFSRALWHALPSHDFAVLGEARAAGSLWTAPAATGDAEGRR